MRSAWGNTKRSSAGGTSISYTPDNVKSRGWTIKPENDYPKMLLELKDRGTTTVRRDHTINYKLTKLLEDGIK